MRFKPSTSRNEVQRFRKRGGRLQQPSAQLRTKQLLMPRIPKTISPGTWPYVTNMKLHVGGAGREGVVRAWLFP
jgi:hypothetical protein